MKHSRSSRRKAKKRISWASILVVSLLSVALCLSTYALVSREQSDSKTVPPSSSSEKRNSGNSQQPQANEPTEQNDQQSQTNENNGNDEPQQTSITFFEPSSDRNKKIERLMKTMSLREKIGQLVIVGFPSTEPDENVKQMIRQYHVGGAILYDRNMKTPEQVATLTNDLQRGALESRFKIPLVFSIDQEGGKIVRMRQYVSPIPSQQQLGQSKDDAKVYQIAHRTGTELAAMGIQINFAPVLDLSATDSRSFGEDPVLTGRLGQQVVTGLTDAGVTAVLKHFPGNGRSQVDPHHDSSSVEAGMEDLENKDILPFRQIITNINHDRFFVMVTHIKYPVYDKEHPASLSSAIIQQLLREKLGYEGIVVTDDLEMGAVSKYFTYRELGYRAIAAGADLLLVCHTFDHQKEVIDGIWDAVQTGKLSEERINESVRKILAYKLSQFPSIENVYVDPTKAKQVVGN
ncbi:Putative anhydromuramoyl-peptide exo-beta-N-acetylglucosaminidase [Geobacillus thermodenitrificans NG80-2]|jgi:beta-N-acetylhexosaminidase|uniref:beta-N-acetylhexosaminidase n=2 Tax=Geobacillus thermodenitrificans TaxID=33940 RepID=A4ITC8_GEOTN|nr:Putative anhydromuramoyl-peptide exo-beta-N-acetylglucosaminidase [Geobacillus thermodenitrificans NG80-2]